MIWLIWSWKWIMLFSLLLTSHSRCKDCIVFLILALVIVLTATPGRLVDHLENTKGFNLRSLKYLVRTLMYRYSLSKSIIKQWSDFHPEIMPLMLKCIIELYRTNENDIYVFERCHHFLLNTKYLILMHFFRLWMKLIGFWIWILNKRYACTAKQTFI